MTHALPPSLDVELAALLGPDGWLTQSRTSDALYFATEAVVLEGPFARRRVFTRGLRGTALVVEVRPTSLVQRRSLLERATETVVVATAQVPRGVPAPQKVPAGQYGVGQVVPVVQHPRDPYRLYLDRPDLEHHPIQQVVYLGGAVIALVALADAVLGRL